MHFEACKAEMTGYFDTKPCRMVQDTDSSRDNPTFTLRVTNPVPARLAFLLGDCLQNVRSALDYLVWELVLAANNQPTKDNAFPICITPEGFTKALKGRRLEGMAAAATDLVAWFQPHRSGGKQEAEGMPLAVLDYLVNVNKHRRVLLTVIRTFPGNELLRFKDGDVEWGLPTPDALQSNVPFGEKLTPSELQGHGGMAALIAFNEGAADGAEVSLTAGSLIDYVADEVIAKFERFF
jgi:hypothetical protein